MHDVHLWAGRRYLILLIFGVDPLCLRPPSGRDGEHPGMGRGVSAVPLEFHSLGVLPGPGRGLRLHAPRPQKRTPEIFRGLPPDPGQAHRRDTWKGHRPAGCIRAAGRDCDHLQRCHAIDVQHHQQPLPYKCQPDSHHDPHLTADLCDLYLFPAAWPQRGQYLGKGLYLSVFWAYCFCIIFWRRDGVYH